MIEALQQQFKTLPAEERLAMLVGYLELARRELDVMIRDSKRVGDDASRQASRPGINSSATSSRAGTTI